MIVDEDVVWVSDPETSGGLVRVQETPRLLGKDCQVTIKVVLCLNCIFNEEGMAHCVISYVMNDSQEADSMNSACSVERLMNCVSLDVGFSDCSDKMEMNGISTKLESLPNIVELNILNSSDDSLTTVSMNHHVSTVLVLKSSFRVSLVNYVPCE